MCWWGLLYVALCRFQRWHAVLFSKHAIYFSYVISWKRFNGKEPDPSFQLSLLNLNLNQVLADVFECGFWQAAALPSFRCCASTLKLLVVHRTGLVSPYSYFYSAAITSLSFIFYEVSANVNHIFCSPPAIVGSHISIVFLYCFVLKHGHPKASKHLQQV